MVTGGSSWGVNATGAWSWPFISIYCRGSECVELYFHSKYLKYWSFTLWYSIYPNGTAVPVKKAKRKRKITVTEWSLFSRIYWWRYARATTTHYFIFFLLRHFAMKVGLLWTKWNRILPKKVIVTQLLKKLDTYIQRFITVFTKKNFQTEPTLSQLNPVQAIVFYLYKNCCPEDHFILSHWVTSQRMILFMVTVVRTSNSKSTALFFKKLSL